MLTDGGSENVNDWVKGFINQLNEDEATAIVNYIETKINITKSVGIATFSVKQKDNVLNELELR